MGLERFKSRREGRDLVYGDFLCIGNYTNHVPLTYVEKVSYCDFIDLGEGELLLLVNVDREFQI